MSWTEYTPGAGKVYVGEIAELTSVLIPFTPKSQLYWSQPVELLNNVGKS